MISNLQFSNEIVIARRHTKNIDNVNVAGNIFQKVANAIGQLREAWQGQEQRVQAYKDYDLSLNSSWLGAFHCPTMSAIWVLEQAPFWNARMMRSLASLLEPRS